ncbi:glycosyltransferase family 4 protein [Jannaschia sp. W003]|uniref:glycosyltransferase family 4 protein n=1 Tax=Jannaschia sp. W003 TaxID=2867012 RepID=UPI0021A64890|nr:glycosyltransferase family 4 protein [Jannaschia sp. W003]UWQ21843.1 glycosyltransferase family 4 protein [Jannaschia sp. W003]
MPTSPPSDAPRRRVLVVVENLPVPFDRRVWLEATTLRAAGYEVSVISPMGRGCTATYECIEGVHVHRHPAAPEARTRALAFVREYLHALRHWFRLAGAVHRARGFDAIHGCNPPDLVWMLALRWRLRGVAYLFDHHDVCPELFEAKFGRRGPLHAALRIMERITFAVADVSIATNESFRSIAVDRGGMAPEDVFVVRSAPRAKSFQPGQGDPRFRRAATMLGWIGVIGQQEGLELLVEAMAHLAAEGRDVHAVVIGTGPHARAVEDAVARAGLEDRFTFTGAVDGKTVLAALNSCDIGVAPDPHNAMNDVSTMNKVVEYMALAKPTVQFALREGRASAGDTALYARPNDPRDFAAKVGWLIDHPEAARGMGARARERVLGTLGWDNSVPHLLAAYDRLWEKRGL